jgi:hypothetical protein
VKPTKEHVRAVHESAHGIAAQTLGFSVARISIEPLSHRGKTIVGHCEYERGTTREDIRRDLVVTLSGCVGVWKLRGLNPPDNLQGVLELVEKQSPFDEKSLRDGLREYCGSDLKQDHVFAEVFQLTENILDRNWRHVEAVADVLMRDGTLEGRPLEDLLANVSGVTAE